MQPTRTPTTRHWSRTSQSTCNLPSESPKLRALMSLHRCKPQSSQMETFQARRSASPLLSCLLLVLLLLKDSAKSMGEEKEYGKEKSDGRVNTHKQSLLVQRSEKSFLTLGLPQPPYLSYSFVLRSMFSLLSCSTELKEEGGPPQAFLDSFSLLLLLLAGSRGYTSPSLSLAEPEWRAGERPYSSCLSAWDTELEDPGSSASGEMSLETEKPEGVIRLWPFLFSVTAC